MRTFQLCITRGWALVLSAVGWTLDHAWQIFAFGVGCTLGAAALEASAMGTSPLVRRDNACYSLGCSPGCSLKWDGPLRLAEIEVAVDDWVGEPDAPVGMPDVHVSSVRVVTRGVPSVQPYLINDPNSYGVPVYINQPPCTRPSCWIASQEDDNYQGLDADQLSDLSNVLDHLIWETPDADIAANVRAIWGQEGVPFVLHVVRNGARYFDQRQTGLACVVQARVWFGFAKGCE